VGSARFFIIEPMQPEWEIIEKIEKLLAPILEEDGLELVETEFKPSGKRWLLRLYIDKEGGVTISDCESVSRDFARILEIEDFIEHAYILEVSSPGLTRPLKTRQDFVRHRGKPCRIITTVEIQGMNEFRGEIGAVNDDTVEVKGKIDVFDVPICAIKKAHLEFDF